MNWLVLIAAGVVEIAWSQSIKPTQNFTRPLPTLLCFVLAAVAVYLLSYAMRTLPVGTAYAVFTGMGAVGAIGLGVIVNKDPLTAGRLVALSMIVGGIMLARATDLRPATGEAGWCLSLSETDERHEARDRETPGGGQLFTPPTKNAETGYRPTADEECGVRAGP
jgi:quaternary ammonium compound-resistance protein SugE